MLTPTFRVAEIPACLAIACICATPSRAATDRPVFVCRSAVPVIFSDRPCAQHAEARVLRVVDPGPGHAATVDPAPPKEATRPRNEPPVEAAKPLVTDDRCRRLRDERDRLDDRMRAGYPAREAARLWNRWREVGAKIYSARC